MSVGDELADLSGLSQLNTIVGPNDAGKTNVLRAIRLIAEALQGPVKNFSAYNHGLDVTKPFRVALFLELDEPEKSALANSMICSALMDSIPGVAQSQALESFREYATNHELKRFFLPLFEDFTLTLEGSGTENYAPVIGFVSKQEKRTLYCHHLGFITAESRQPTSYTTVSPIGFLLEQLKLTTPALGEFLESKSATMPAMNGSALTVFDVDKSTLRTQAPVGLQINRWGLDNLEPRFKELKPLQELRQFFRDKGAPIAYNTMFGLPDLVELIFLTSLMSLPEVRGYPRQNTVEGFQPDSVPRHSISSDNLPEFLFGLKNGDSFRDRQRFEAIQKKFAELAEGAEFDVAVKTRMIAEQASPVEVLQIKSSGIGTGTAPTDAGQGTTSRLVHHLQIEVVEGGLPFPIEYSAAGVYELLLLTSAIVRNRDKVILLDEPAQNLHPTMQNRLLSLVNESIATYHNQFLIVTHSPYFVSASTLDTTWRFQRENGTTHAINMGVLLKQLREVDQTKVLTKMVDTNVRSLLFSRGVVLVEGPSDKIVVEKVDQALSLSNKSCDLQKKEWGVVDIGGKNSMGTFLKLCSLLHLPRVVVVDYDSLMSCDHVATDSNGNEITMSAVPFYLSDSKELNQDEAEFLRQLQTRIQVREARKWYTDQDLPELRRLATSHRVFVFRKDLEGALRTSVNKKQSKPLKSLEVVMEQIEAGRIPDEFNELGSFLLESVS
jgi:hypothetical protein